MTIGIVHLLEVIQVEINNTHLTVASLFDGLVDQFMDSVAVWQPGNRVGIRQHAQPFLRTSFFRDVRTGTDQVDFVFTAAAVDKFIAKQKQTLSLAGLYPAFHFIRIAVAKEAADVATRSGGFPTAHEEFKDALSNHFLLFQAGVLFTQSIEALNVTPTVEDHNRRVGFCHYLFSK
ncbi:hypothetical protein SDC9_192317 [bioreactor metagenome]|uniref:Uncharacterized protein n=1 Tax=bioreactor metagenome TaxID=1076179 RepID=A0A645I1Y6_9ZZZZ